MKTTRLAIAILLTVITLCNVLAQQQTIKTIAFGSCSDEDDPDQMWSDVIAQKPDLWIWMGDNIYGDTPDMEIMKAKYERQKAEPGYQQLIKTCPIVGTWDDHDYGINDGGKYFRQKEESKKLALDFLDVPAKAKVRKREGIYDSYSFGSAGKKVKVILLDTRSFRDTVIFSTVPGKRYQPNPEGDLLGEAQWKWLEKELKKSDAQINIIVSSIQFVSAEHGWETWGNFPKSRQQMIDLLVRVKPDNTFFISGDRHIAEISKMTLEGLPYPVYDFTASGLTHTWDTEREEKNDYRVGRLIVKKNFGVIRITWDEKLPTVIFEVRGKDGALWQSIPVRF
jgi:alkaline phosphatase D